MKGPKAEKTRPIQVAGWPGAWMERSPFLFSFLVVAFLAGLSLLFFRPFFVVNDDTFKLFFVKGVGAELQPNEYLGHSNILPGILLKALYTVAPTLPWYGLYIFLPLVGGLWAFCASLFLNPSRTKLPFFLMFFLSTGLYYLYQVNFAITPNLATQGGIFLLAFVWGSSDRRLVDKAFWLAGSLFLVSALIRLDGFILALLTDIPFFIFLYWEKRGGKFHRRPALLVAATLLLIGASALFSHFYYQHSLGWKKFLEFNHYIESLKDYRNTEYNDRTKPYFDEAGWSKNDFDLFKDFCYVDEGKCSVENFKKLMAHFPRMTAVGKPGTVSSLADVFYDRYSQGTVLYLLLFLLFCRQRYFRLILLNFLWTMLLLLFIIYFYRAPERVFLPMLTFVQFLSIYYCDPEGKGPFQIPSANRLFALSRTALLVLWVILLFPAVRNHWYFNAYQKYQEGALNYYLGLIKPQKDQLYVIWDSSFPYESTNVFDSFEKFRNFNIYPLAVFQRSPHGADMLEHFGVKDVFRDMVDNPKIFLICNKGEGALYAQYLLERYGLSIVSQKVFSTDIFPWFRVYRIYSKPPIGGKN